MRQATSRTAAARLTVTLLIPGMGIRLTGTAEDSTLAARAQGHICDNMSPRVMHRQCLGNPSPAGYNQEQTITLN